MYVCVDKHSLYMYNHYTEEIFHLFTICNILVHIQIVSCLCCVKNRLCKQITVIISDITDLMSASIQDLCYIVLGLIIIL